MLVILSTLTFVLPDDSGEELLTGVLLLLVFIVFMFILSDSSPHISHNFPIMGKTFNPFI